MSRTVHTPFFISSSPRMATKRAPSLSASFMRDLKLRPSGSRSTRTPACRSPAGGSVPRRTRPRPRAAGTRPPRRSPSAGRHGEHDPLHARGEADPGEVRPAEVLHEPVVAAAPEQAVLRAQRTARHLERRPRVVVEAAHQAMVDAVADPQEVELAADLREVIAARRAEVLEDPGQRRRSAPAPRAPSNRGRATGSSPFGAGCPRRDGRGSRAGPCGAPPRTRDGKPRPPPSSARPRTRDSARLEEPDRDLDHLRIHLRARADRRPRRPPGGTAGSGPSGAARGGTSGRARRP